VASNDKVRSLVDENGYFHHDWTATTRIDRKEVELELRAQIDPRPTPWAFAPPISIPTNTGSMRMAKDLFEVVLRLAHDYKLPVFVGA